MTPADVEKVKRLKSAVEQSLELLSRKQIIIACPKGKTVSTGTWVQILSRIEFLIEHHYPQMEVEFVDPATFPPVSPTSVLAPTPPSAEDMI